MNEMESVSAMRYKPSANFIPFIYLKMNCLKLQIRTIEYLLVKRNENTINELNDEEKTENKWNRLIRHRK